MEDLGDWENFYLIIGGAAGALIGLQFVFITLIADRTEPNIGEASAAFATPTIVHFALVLLLAALTMAPWSGLTWLSPSWGLVGLGGLLYVCKVIANIKIQTLYKPVFEDWFFHVIFPTIAYLSLIASAFTAHSFPRPTLFWVAAAQLFLLFSGIHNAWDAVTYNIFYRNKDLAKPL